MIFHLQPRAFTRPCSLVRQLSTSQQIPKHSIYVSNSTNPYFNLSLEDWLFRNKPHNDPLLLIYRDEPCVVIGRNQNPWKEISMPLLRDLGVPFIRRRSGGGTVYHVSSDLGNSNFSIHLPRATFDRNESAQVVLRALKSLGIDEANVNTRNDICVGRLKISSAYKIVNNRAYHHGTMLISTQLGTLGKLLRSDKDTMVTKGVTSVPSPVCNLQQYNPGVSHTDFVDAVVREFQENYKVYEPVHWVDEDAGLEGSDSIRKGISELSTWQWAFGQTPEFTYTLQNPFAWGEITTRIHSKHGIIRSCDFDVANLGQGVGEARVRRDLDELAKQLPGQKYGFLDCELKPDQGLIKDVWSALVQAMSS